MAAQKQYYYGTGRRKTSIAKVFLCSGKGKIIINKCSIDDYFGRETLRMIVNQPLVVTNTTGKFDIYTVVKGGGDSGQAGAIRLGITRALIDYDEKTSPPSSEIKAKMKKTEESKETLEGKEGKESEEGEGESASTSTESLTPITFRRLLRKAGLVTRDSRIVERKKVGRHKARKGTQYSKR